ncbi:uncharacterized protein PGTG_07473 [Puccinia graminis f. sp. tritici CRL 75-36-700-3]|uniref:Uncharacterized protein n=1 Tax=Puccinia graminis f. sp. tritici (strain CRL 75-36-700-3 / race SCCL) TaxID=418459 RepID=E3KD16_PUCGT|nr:uncharacterized protein PGTG_07473 [Puccinia graminis f. sp. tritici CRL 75-36-700-3]EFP82076.2 hypothetical protein PGTG_07473 [Puccinia graminis f. sp. tritici CRL 75-36-700-3]
MAEACSSPEFSSVIEGSLLKTLRQTADLTRKFNENLDCLAIQGINSMVVFVFQNNADDCNLTEALVDWQEDVLIKNLVNWRDAQNTHTCMHLNLTNLLRVIQLTASLNKQLLKQNIQLINIFSRMIKAIKQSKPSNFGASSRFCLGACSEVWFELLQE